MNRNSLRSFAAGARQELIERIQQKAYELGITEDKIKKAQIEASDAIYINGKALDKAQVQQRNSLIKEIQLKGYRQVIEEAAYTWFNRFCALRFMEVNDYLPSGVRALSSILPGSVEPDILREALQLDLDLDREIVLALKEQNDINGLFKYMLIKQCNSLNSILPFLFEPVEDYTEILFPDNLLKEGTFLRAMVNTDNITEDDWQDVEIIGWLYQYYIAEKKDQVFADLKKNIKITPENIPAATQLFTPHWIVRYLVENSLGRLWMLNHPESKLIEQMDYYIKPEQQEQENGDIPGTGVSPFLIINSPEEIKICDPACGSGHMLLYAFDLLYAIYEESGYQPSEIPAKILANNLYGIEIDERAGEMAAFALTMKARSKYRRFFRKLVQPNICILRNIHFEIEELSNYMDEVGHDLFTANLKSTLTQFEEADNFGSLIRPWVTDVKDTFKLLEVKNLSANLFLNVAHQKVLQSLKQADYLSPKYHVVIANPPYMGGKGMNGRLKAFAEDKYPDSKSDLFAMFMERNLDMVVNKGLIAMITMQSWMFLSSFEKLREKLLTNDTMLSMAHLGARAFDSIGGEVVSTTAFVIEKEKHNEYKGAYLRLVDGNCEMEKEEVLKQKRMSPCYASSKDLKKIPSSPIAYWVSERFREVFCEANPFEAMAEVKHGLSTGNNDAVVRVWHEVSYTDIGLNINDRDEALKSDYKWFPYNKGGNFRKWFGNHEYVLRYDLYGNDLMASFSGHRHDGKSHYFKEGITWTFISSSGFAARYTPKGFIFDVSGSSLFVEYPKIVVAFLCSILCFDILEVLNPTLNFQVGNIKSLPFLDTEIGKKINRIDTIAEWVIQHTKLDWDEYETSWNFTTLPLLHMDLQITTFKQNYNHLRTQWRKITIEMQLLEEENNRIFIEAYGLQDELTPDVPLSEITLTCNPYYRYGSDKTEEELEARLLLDTIKEFISYAVGCMFGRYSLDKEGLIFAGGNFDPAQYKTFPADQDNVIPVLADDYFKDDIVSRFVDFVRITFGEDKLDENLDFIADTLGRKANETSRDSIRRYFVNDFYKDHVQTYKKRPIYWMFTSGKEKAFNCLVYLHRYQPDTIATIRTDYLHRLQEALEVEKSLQQRIVSEQTGSSAARGAAKRLTKLDKQLLELKKYDELVHHYADMRIRLDLDDGVKVNYAKMAELLVKI